MEPISSVSRYPLRDYQGVNSVRSPRIFTPDAEVFNVDRNYHNTQDPGLIERLPSGPAQDVADIFKNIQALSFQAAEQGQSFNELEQLQARASEELFTLRSVLQTLSEDDLQLFAAVFQNPSLNFSSDSGSGNNDIFQSDTSFLNSSDTDTLDRLLQIDLRTEQGILSSLNLTGGILDTLSIFNSGSNLLEIFLENLITLDSSIASIDDESQDQEDSSDSGNTTNDSSDNRNPIIISPDADPLTIIELAG